eukprot:TRINITY_DN59242_c0_g1_i1.p1 TRINITY_DN59242_c0_g1~~TRINITY_DN59242_c0_g1_i1.p1  ORF type:complete len:879 (-),score=183.49 TRINITY_DN59242_c0_g1_i1:570-3206(-)
MMEPVADDRVRVLATRRRCLPARDIAAIGLFALVELIDFLLLFLSPEADGGLEPCALGWAAGLPCGTPFLVAAILRILCLTALCIVARRGPVKTWWTVCAKLYPYLLGVAPTIPIIARLISEPPKRPEDADSLFWSASAMAALAIVTGWYILRRAALEGFQASAAAPLSSAAVELLPREGGNLTSNGDVEHSRITDSIISSPASPNAAAETEDDALPDGKDVAKNLSAMFLVRLIMPDWPLLINASIFLVSAAILETLQVHFLSQTLQDIISAQTTGELTPEVFQRPVAKLLTCAFACAVCSSCRGATFLLLGSRASLRLRCQLFDSLLKQEVGFFDKTKTGELTSRLTQDCQKVTDTVELNVNVFLRTLVSCITTLGFMFYLSRELTMISFVAVPLIVAISKEYGSIMKTISERRQKKLADANTVAEETLSSLSTVRYFAAEDLESIRFANKLREFCRVQITYAGAYLGYLTCTITLPQAVACIVLLHGGRLCMHGMPGSSLLAFVMYLQTLNNNFSSIADFYSNIVQALGAAARVFQLIERQPRSQVKIPVSGAKLSANICKIVSTLKPVPLIREGYATSGTLPASLKVEGALEFRNVCFHYPTRPKQQVLKGLNLRCEPGKVVALVGPSGGGKSTVISLLERLYEAGSGSVLLDGRDVRDYPHDWYHEQLSIVGQEPTLFGRSIRENILYGLAEDRSEWERPERQNGSLTSTFSSDCLSPGKEVEEVAMLANAHNFIKDMAKGYDTDVGERGVQLSGGQKQRLAIARALVRRPRVLLLDEATSALDAESEQLVQQAIDNMIAKKDMTVVVVAHRLSTVRNADKICVIKGGVVCEEGNHDELLKIPDGQYASLVGRQLTGSGTPKVANGAATPKSP